MTTPFCDFLPPQICKTWFFWQYNMKECDIAYVRKKLEADLIGDSGDASGQTW